MLGLKALTNPLWASFINIYKEGAVVDVKVSAIEEGCVICEVIEGITGRMPVKIPQRLPEKGRYNKSQDYKIDKEQKKVFWRKDIEMTEEKTA